MQRDDCWVNCAKTMRWGTMAALLFLLLSCGWTQNSSGSPMVVFLEPSEGATISSDAETVQIRFRLISPDNTNLMRYQPFVNGLPGNEPIPIEPPSPQVELTILWRGIKQFPDGIHIITIKVVDSKGREGMGSLTLYKGRDSNRPTAEILTPKSGDTVRGEVPILVRISDDRGVKAITVSATQRETSKTQTIYLAVGNYGRFMEIRVLWNTAEKHPETKNDLFPDGIYLLQAKVRDIEDNEGVSNEVLIIVQNKIAQPVISQINPNQATRGGAAPPIVPEKPSSIQEPKTLLTLETPTKLSSSTEPIPFKLQKPEQPQGQPTISLPTTQVRPSVPKSQGKVLTAEIEIKPSAQEQLMQVAIATPILQPRLNLALPTPETIRQPETSKQEEIVNLPVSRSDLPLPRVAGSVSSSRPNLSLSRGETKLTEAKVKPQLPLSASPTPQVATIVRAPISAPIGQIKLASAWLPPSPSTLRREPEVPETPLIAPPMSVPRLPEPEVKTKKSAPNPLPRPKFTIQPAHSLRYTVIAGDTLYSLAEKFGISVKDLAEANGIPENSPLRIGQRLIIPSRPVTVLVDGKTVQSEVSAFVREGVVVGSLRSVIEASKGVIGWDNERKKATATLGSLSIIATIGEKTLDVNGERVPLSIAPFLLQSRTFLPLRELGISMGKEVRWKKGILLIETPKP
ncbi:MAG: stalk domain-containing protein [Armatimonadetes bacterium]|nr:stalk domain-containing protein [Armatimonadota bacterium]